MPQGQCEGCRQTKGLSSPICDECQMIGRQAARECRKLGGNDHECLEAAHRAIYARRPTRNVMPDL